MLVRSSCLHWLFIQFWVPLFYLLLLLFCYYFFIYHYCFIFYLIFIILFFIISLFYLLFFYVIGSTRHVQFSSSFLLPLFISCLFSSLQHFLLQCLPLPPSLPLSFIHWLISSFSFSIIHLHFLLHYYIFNLCLFFDPWYCTDLNTFHLFLSQRYLLPLSSKVSLFPESRFSWLPVTPRVVASVTFICPYPCCSFPFSICSTFLCSLIRDACSPSPHITVSPASVYLSLCLFRDSWCSPRVLLFPASTHLHPLIRLWSMMLACYPSNLYQFPSSWCSLLIW